MSSQNGSVVLSVKEERVGQTHADQLLRATGVSVQVNRNWETGLWEVVVPTADFSKAARLYLEWQDWMVDHKRALSCEEQESARALRNAV